MLTVHLFQCISQCDPSKGSYLFRWSWVSTSTHSDWKEINGTSYRFPCLQRTWLESNSLEENYPGAAWFYKCLKKIIFWDQFFSCIKPRQKIDHDTVNRTYSNCTWIVMGYHTIAKFWAHLLDYEGFEFSWLVTFHWKWKRSTSQCKKLRMSDVD